MKISTLIPIERILHQPTYLWAYDVRRVPLNGRSELGDGHGLVQGVHALLCKYRGSDLG